MVIELRRTRLPDGGWVTLYSDITARKQAEDAQARAREQAEMAAQEKSRFVAIVSHEIRTPLNVALNSLGLLDQSSLTAGAAATGRKRAAGGRVAAWPAERHPRPVAHAGRPAAGAAGPVHAAPPAERRGRPVPLPGRGARGRAVGACGARRAGPADDRFGPAAAGADEPGQQHRQVRRARPCFDPRRFRTWTASRCCASRCGIAGRRSPTSTARACSGRSRSSSDRAAVAPGWAWRSASCWPTCWAARSVATARGGRQGVLAHAARRRDGRAGRLGADAGGQGDAASGCREPACCWSRMCLPTR